MAEFKFNYREDFNRFRAQIRNQTISRAKLKSYGRGLYIRGEVPCAFELDYRQLADLMGYLLGLATLGPREVVGALNHAALMWLREIQRHMPVDTGLLRESMNISPAHMGQTNGFEASVGSNVPYLFYLEFGTRYIAGGQVRNWRPGQSPIIMWPAKAADLPDPGKSKPGTKARARKEAILAKAMDAANTEFMPPMRGSWQLIREQVVLAIRERLAKALQKRAGQ